MRNSLLLPFLSLLAITFQQQINGQQANAEMENESEFWRSPLESQFSEDEQRAGERVMEDRLDDWSDEGVMVFERRGGGGPPSRQQQQVREELFQRPRVPPPPRPQPAGLRALDLESLCFGNGDKFALGPCSSTFLKCGLFSANRRFAFEECPLGSVFVGKECKPARKVRDCFLPEVNLLNDAVEKLAQAVDFCARKEPFESVLYHFDGPSKEDKCSRQALLCRGSAVPPLAISCPSGKILDPKGIRCEDSPDHCAFVPGSAQTPIRLHLLRLACAQQKQQQQKPVTAPLFPNSIQSQLDAQQQQHQQTNGKDRCRNWYFMCEAGDEPEFVLCDSGKLFDAAKRVCRRILPEDRCPHLGACRGWEWRMSPVADCRPDFLFCNGMRPQMFQCERPGEVFKDGACVLATSAACDVCQPGQMKRSTEKCEEFYFCELDTASSSNSGSALAPGSSSASGSALSASASSSSGRTQWRQYMCTNSRLFDPQRRECVQPSEYQCPIRTQCQEGDTYSVECGDFFICAQGKFVAGKCPDMTRWDGTERRCLFSTQCRRFQDVLQTDMGVNGQQKCLSGQTKPSPDCKRFEECIEGRWISRACQEYASDRLKDPCRFCPEPGVAQQKDFYPLERLLPDGFNPFDGQGVKQRRCVEGEKIVNRHDCARFMECLDGDWFNLACPRGHFFSPRTQGCVMASSANSSAVPMCQDLIPAPIGGSSSGQNVPESVHLLPLYSPNDTLLVIGGGIAPGAGPLPELGDKELRQNYEGNFEFCTALSPQRVASKYDCTKYRECALDRGGYYAEKLCAIGTQFDPSKLQCTYNYTCSPPSCVEGNLEPLEQCGRARQCRSGKWHAFSCPNVMAFVGGKCSDRIRCQSTNPIVRGQCLDGHTRAHQTDCSKYLLCRFGQFVEENCNLGHRFNPNIGHCDPKYDCPASHRPPCYEGEIRAIGKSSSGTSSGIAAAVADYDDKCPTDYELCRDGRFLRQSCPYGEHFHGGRCQQVVGECANKGGGGGGGGTSGSGTAGQDGDSQQKCKESPGPQGFRADRQKCSKFYQCAQGKWTPKDCAKGTVFNPTLGVCDWPANVPGC